MDDLKWAENLKPEPMQHYSFPFGADLVALKTQSLTQAYVIDMADKAIADAVLAEARTAGITNLYLLDRKFVLDALREKIERERDVDRGW